MARVLVTEKLSPEGLDRLRRSGHEVEEKFGLDHAELLDAVRGAHALIVRSATTVSADVIAAGVGLVAVGRAGVGLDNVDVDAATRQGVLVANAPHANTVSAAEHTMALLLAQARNVPQASAALRAGNWERSQWTGVELAEKTLGIVGLGRIGKLVAQRALAFNMHVIAYDPYIAPERAKQMGVDLMALDDLVAGSDFLSLHVAKTPETTNLIDAEMLARAKPGLRIVNVARGGVVNEADLAAAIESGAIAGAAIDVFENEPATSSPLFGLRNVVVTPHLGASTVEAQEKASLVIAEQIELALAGDFVPFAVNVKATEASETVRPFLPLAEQLGVLFAGLAGTGPGEIHVDFAGEIGGYDNTITQLAILKGMLRSHPGTRHVSFVNALDIAKEAGLTVMSSTTTETLDHLNSVTIRNAEHSIAGTLVGVHGDPRIVLVDDHVLDLPPAPYMLVVRNDDRPGVIGRVGTLLGESGININDMHVGRSADGDGALMVIATESPASSEVQAALEALDGVSSCAAIVLAPG